MSTDPKEPAYPRDHRHDGHNGVTKREYFAAAALQGLLAGRDSMWAPEQAAGIAYKYADAMIDAALNNEPPER